MDIENENPNIIKLKACHRIVHDGTYKNNAKIARAFRISNTEVLGSTPRFIVCVTTSTFTKTAQLNV